MCHNYHTKAQVREKMVSSKIHLANTVHLIRESTISETRTNVREENSIPSARLTPPPPA